MKRRSLMLAVVGLGMALTLGFAVAPALALSLQGNYFVLGSLNVDTLGGIDGQTLNLFTPGVNASLVNSALVGGLPVYSGLIPPSGSPATGGGSGKITDVSATNQIEWWTVHGSGNTGVSVDASIGGGSGVRTDAFVGPVLGGPAFSSSFFPNGNANDSSGYRAVHWTGAFHVATTASLTLSADDDAFLFLNGNLALDNGGVKALSLATTTSTTLGPGDYVVDLFFADRHVSQSGIAFSCEGCLDPVPEPTTLLLFGTTLAGLGTVVRRRLKGRVSSQN
jgi:fibro-slime domain-containing protein